MRIIDHKKDPDVRIFKLVAQEAGSCKVSVFEEVFQACRENYSHHNKGEAQARKEKSWVLPYS